MTIASELREAMDDGREELIAVLAEHRLVPELAGTSSSSLLGDSAVPKFELVSRGERDEAQHVDRQTGKLVLDTLGVSSEEECESVVEEITGHDAWE